MARKTIAIGVVFVVLSCLIIPSTLVESPPVLAGGASIAVEQPKAGDVLVAGSAYTIRWNTSLPPAEATVVGISFTANGSNWEWVANAENNGAYPWIVPKVSTNQAQLGLSWAYSDPPQSVLAGAFSDKFSIVPPLPPAVTFSSWPMIGGDAQHTCRSSLAVPDLPQKLWSYDAQQEISDAHQAISSSLVVGPGGVIYFVADTKLVALNPDGTKRWVQSLGGEGSTPAVSPDGTVYVCVEKQLLSYDSAGNWKWTYTTTTNPLGGVLTSPPIVADDGTIYANAYFSTLSAHHLKAISPDGTEKWSYPVSPPVLPVLDKDGTVYLGSRLGDTQGFFDAVKPDGSQRWRVEMSSAVWSPPTVNPDGSIYTIAGDGTFKALGPDGVELWRYTEPGDVLMEAGVAVGQGGLILYQMSAGGSYQLIALDPNTHSKKWAFSTGEGGPLCQQIVDQNGRIYAGLLAHTKLFVLDPSDGHPITTLITEDKVHSLAIGEGGALLATVGQKVVAFGAGPTPPTPPPTSFPDVPTDYWAYPEIMELVKAGAINGYPDGTFKPEFPVTRAEFAKMVVLTLSIPQTTPATPSFSDLNPAEWYYGYVEGAVEHGLIKGYPDGTFQPQGNITLAEVLTVVLRTTMMIQIVDPFGPLIILLRDRDDSLRPINADDWFYNIVAAAVAQGYLMFPDKVQITKPGANSGEYEIRLNSPASRAQTAVFLSRIKP